MSSKPSTVLVVGSGPIVSGLPGCHSERSEASLAASRVTLHLTASRASVVGQHVLRCAQDEIGNKVDDPRAGRGIGA